MKLKHKFDRFINEGRLSVFALKEQEATLRKASVHLHRSLGREEGRRGMRAPRLTGGPNAHESLFATISMNFMMAEYLANEWIPDKITTRLFIHEERKKGLQGNFAFYIRTNPDLYGPAVKVLAWAGNHTAQRTVRQLIEDKSNWTVNYDVLLAGLLMGATTAEEFLTLADLPAEMLTGMVQAEVDAREAGNPDGI